MPFDWREYLKTAEQLKTVGGESNYRSGVSRAYYSAYGLCFTYAKNVNYVTAQEITNEGAKMHKFLATRLKRDVNKELRKLGHYLDTMRINRNLADYDAKREDFKTAAVLISTIALANQLTVELKSYKDSQS